jgi:hypothetical protein
MQCCTAHMLSVQWGLTADDVAVAVASAWLSPSGTVPPYLPGGCDGLLHPELPAAAVRARGRRLCSCSLASAPAEPARQVAQHTYRALLSCTSQRRPNCRTAWTLTLQPSRPARCSLTDRRMPHRQLASRAPPAPAQQLRRALLLPVGDVLQEQQHAAGLEPAVQLAGALAHVVDRAQHER